MGEVESTRGARYHRRMRTRPLRRAWLLRPLYSLLVLTLAGCLWDPDFFDTYPEAGVPPPGAGGAGPGPVGPAPDLGPRPDMGPVVVSGRGPDCAVGGCALARITGTGQLVAIAPDGGGGLWVLVNGPATQVSASAEQALDPNAPAHLIHLSGGGFGLDFVAPLPFRGSGLAASNTAVFIAGHGLQGGDLLGTPMDPELGNAIVARIANQQLQWWMTWSAPTAPLMASEGPTSIWVAGAPGNATLHLNGAVVREGADPNAPGQFLARLGGLGTIEWIQPYGAPDASASALSVGGGSHAVLAATGSGALWDATPLMPGVRTVAQVNAQGGIVWTSQWTPPAVDVDGAAVDAGNRTWLLGRASGDGGELPLEPPAGQPGYDWLGLALPNGMVSGASGLTTEGGGGLDAITVATDGALVLGQSYGAISVAERSLTGPGLFAAGVNTNVRSTWMRIIAPPSPNAPLGRAVAEGGGYQYAAADVYSTVEWGDYTAPYAGQPMVVIWRWPIP